MLVWILGGKDGDRAVRGVAVVPGSMELEHGSATVVNREEEGLIYWFMSHIWFGTWLGKNQKCLMKRLRADGKSIVKS